MKRIAPAWILACLLLAPPAAAGEPESLLLVRSTDRPTLSALLARDVLVAFALDDYALVFADSHAAALLEQMRLPYQVLEKDVRGREHYLITPRRGAALEQRGATLDSLREPARLLHFDGTEAVASVPEGQVRLLLDLGFEVGKISHAPIRLLDGRGAPRIRVSDGHDPFVQDLVDRVSTDSIDATVEHLQSFITRLAYRREGVEAAIWLQKKLASYGLASSLWDWSATYAPNVVAEIPGITTPDVVYLIGAHFDSYSHEDAAPGADDNASGTAAVLECARILARQRFACTLRFLAFSAEEEGLLGSDAYAAAAVANGEDIAGMVNVDMIGYRGDGDRRDLDIIYIPPEATWLYQAASQAATLYVPGFPIVTGKVARGRSDQESFSKLGYSAIWFFEDVADYSPYIHTAGDVVGQSYNDPLLATLSIKTAVALLATLATPLRVPIAVEDFEAASGTGGVRLAWRLSATALHDLAAVRVQRAGDEAGPYVERAQPALAPAASMSFEDADVRPGRDYWYRLLLESERGQPAVVGPVEVRVAETAPRTALHAPSVPRDGGPVRIRYAIGPEAPAASLDIYDVRGRRVRLLAQGLRQPGEYSCLWNRYDDRGARAARGVYFVQLRAAGTRLARKFFLVHD